MFSFDHSINNIFSNIDNSNVVSLSNYFSHNAFYFASWLFNTTPFIVLLLISSWLIYKKYGKNNAIMFFSASALAFLVSWLLKICFAVPRPLNEKILAFGPSFPSIHATVATAYFLSLLHFLRHTKNKWRRYIHVLFCIFCPLFVGVSRLYFGVHWLSDVLAGYVIGAFSVYVVIRFFRGKEVS